CDMYSSIAASCRRMTSIEDSFCVVGEGWSPQRNILSLHGDQYASIRQDGSWNARHTARMRRRVLVLAMSFALSAAAAAAADSDALVGLWKAKRWLKPHVRSTLIIQRNGGAYTADLAGRVLATTVKGRELSFRLPNGRESFRGHVEAEEIAGWWYQPNAILVRLHKAGAHRW